MGKSKLKRKMQMRNGMKNKNVKNGLATLCIGGGEASAIIVESYD